ncbi:Uncharacterised protein [uncultured archaeon]|nr:Uncharacterised protein [uncultured archaeon]
MSDIVDPNRGSNQVIAEFLNAAVQYEACQQIGTLPYERSPERKATKLH